MLNVLEEMLGLRSFVICLVLVSFATKCRSPLAPPSTAHEIHRHAPPIRDQVQVPVAAMQAEHGGGKDGCGNLCPAMLQQGAVAGDDQSGGDAIRTPVPLAVPTGDGPGSGDVGKPAPSPSERRILDKISKAIPLMVLVVMAGSTQDLEQFLARQARGVLSEVSGGLGYVEEDVINSESEEDGDFLHENYPRFKDFTVEKLGGRLHRCEVTTDGDLRRVLSSCAWNQSSSEYEDTYFKWLTLDEDLRWSCVEEPFWKNYTGSMELTPGDDPEWWISPTVQVEALMLLQGHMQEDPDCQKQLAGKPRVAPGTEGAGNLRTATPLCKKDQLGAKIKEIQEEIGKADDSSAEPADLWRFVASP